MDEDQTSELNRPITGYHVYNLYLRVKIHFNSKSFEFNKQTYIPALSKNAYKKRKDKYFFDLLSNKSQEYLLDYFVSNFIKNKRFWIGDIEVGEKNYKKHIAKKDSLTYNFKSEIKNLKRQLGKNVEINNGELPYLVTLYYEDKISLETLIMIMDSLNIHDFFDEKLSDNPLWSNLTFTIKKYKYFFRYDVFKYKNIFKQFCKSCKEEV